MNRIARETVSPRPRVPSREGLADTPFEPRLRALSTAEDWMDWSGCLSPRALGAVETEYFAIRNQATLFDVSPMHKYRVTGPDAERVVNRLVTRDVARLAPGRVAYVLWCDEDGMVIDDGTLFRLGPQDFRLCCQERQFAWLHDIAWGFDVAIADETGDVAGLALQGPTSHAVLEAAGLALPDLRPFGIAEPEPGLVISRTGFSGDLGYELWLRPEGALALWDRLWVAGADLGLRAIGFAALDIARIEAGFIMAGAEFQPIHRALRPSRGRTPFELGLGHLVDPGKPHFNGRRALLREAARTPRRQLVMLDIEGTKDASGALVYHRGRREAGHATSAVWAPTAKRNIAFAELDARAARSAGLRAEIYTLKEGRWERTMASATVIDRGVFRPPRARATPPGRF
ncbi:aminomethyltransferase family protein [Limibaculum sp. M0105]|uniref:Aminomethyltransferase family protein n=1 Tax=Thermohalobaculum xanthum TaxID=2753746 RepID=A0A8J7M7X5_9RHOB|nr:aminomethyltransferase family protein [Thermohalobaculum xanthum]MBK0399189.1 aminomethyltransferase family protein [Thermohalobaculum xanthum]